MKLTYAILAMVLLSSFNYGETWIAQGLWSPSHNNINDSEGVGQNSADYCGDMQPLDDVGDSRMRIGLVGAPFIKNDFWLNNSAEQETYFYPDANGNFTFLVNIAHTIAGSTPGAGCGAASQQSLVGSILFFNTTSNSWQTPSNLLRINWTILNYTCAQSATDGDSPPFDQTCGIHSDPYYRMAGTALYKTVVSANDLPFLTQRTKMKFSVWNADFTYTNNVTYNYGFGGTFEDVERWIEPAPGVRGSQDNVSAVASHWEQHNSSAGTYVRNDGTQGLGVGWLSSNTERVGYVVFNLTRDYQSELARAGNGVDYIDDAELCVFPSSYGVVLEGAAPFDWGVREVPINGSCTLNTILNGGALLDPANGCNASVGYVSRSLPTWLNISETQLRGVDASAEGGDNPNVPSNAHYPEFFRQCFNVTAQLKNSINLYDSHYLPLQLSLLDNTNYFSYGIPSASWTSLDYNAVYTNGFGFKLNDGYMRPKLYVSYKPQCVESETTGVISNNIPGDYKGYWALDINSSTTAIDSSSYGNDGSVSGMVWDSSGKIGGTYQGGSGSINVGNSSSLNNSDWAVSFWMKDGLPGCACWYIPGFGCSYTPNQGRVLAKGTGWYVYFESYNCNPTTRGRLRFESEGGSSAYFDAYYPNTWYHIVISSAGKLYVNGVQYGATISITPPPLSAPLTLYDGPYPPAGQFSGKLDEIRYYGRSLTATEITTLGETVPLESNVTNTSTNQLVLFNVSDNTGVYPKSYNWTIENHAFGIPLDYSGLWRFNINSSTTAIDSSVNGNNGVVSGLTWSAVNGHESTGTYGPDNSGSINVGNGSTLNSSNWTIAFWLRNSLVSTGYRSFYGYWTQTEEVMSKSNGNGWHIFMTRRYGSTTSPVHDSGSFGLPYPYSSTENLLTFERTGASISAVLLPNVWYHIIASSDGTIYVNGVQSESMGITSAPVSSPLILYSAPSYIIDDQDEPFQGSLDNVYFYNRTLSSAEVGILAGTAPGGTARSFYDSFLDEGTFHWNLTVNDTGGCAILKTGVVNVYAPVNLTVNPVTGWKSAAFNVTYSYQTNWTASWCGWKAGSMDWQPITCITPGSFSVDPAQCETDGVCTIQVRVNIAGNASSSIASTVASIDTTAPTISSVVLDNSTLKAGSPVIITTNGTDATSGVSTCYAYLSPNSTYNVSTAVQLDDLGSDCNGTATIPSNTTLGFYYIIIRPVDGVGLNAESSSIIVEVTDGTPPVVAELSPLSNSWINGSVKQIKYSITSDGVSNVTLCWWKYKNSTNDWSGNFQLSSCPPAEYVEYGDWIPFNFNTRLCADTASAVCQVGVFAMDNNGNIGNYTNLYKVDNTNPTISNVSLNASSGAFGETITVTTDGVDATSGVSTCYAYLSNDIVYSANDGSLGDLGSDCNGSFTVPSNHSGNYSVIVRPVDLIGHSNTSYAAFAIVDDSAPSIVITAPANNSWANGTIYVYYTAGDAAEDTLRSRFFNGAWSDWTVRSWNLGWMGVAFDTIACPDSLAPTCIFELEGNDTSGNIGSANISLKIDNTPPTITQVSLNETFLASENESINITTDAYDSVGIQSCDVYYSPLDGLYGNPGNLGDADVWLADLGSSCNGTVNVTNVTGGAHNLVVVVKDWVNHTSQAAANIVIGPSLYNPSSFRVNYSTLPDGADNCGADGVNESRINASHAQFFNIYPFNTSADRVLVSYVENGNFSITIGSESQSITSNGVCADNQKKQAILSFTGLTANTSIQITAQQGDAYIESVEALSNITAIYQQMPFVPEDTTVRSFVRVYDANPDNVSLVYNITGAQDLEDVLNGTACIKVNSPLGNYSCTYRTPSLGASYISFARMRFLSTVNSSDFMFQGFDLNAPTENAGYRSFPDSDIDESSNTSLYFLVKMEDLTPRRIYVTGTGISNTTVYFTLVEELPLSYFIGYGNYIFAGPGTYLFNVTLEDIVGHKTQIATNYEVRTSILTLTSGDEVILNPWDNYIDPGFCGQAVGADCVDNWVNKTLPFSATITLVNNGTANLVHSFTPYVFPATATSKSLYQTSPVLDNAGTDFPLVRSINAGTTYIFQANFTVPDVVEAEWTQMTDYTPPNMSVPCWEKTASAEVGVEQDGCLRAFRVRDTGKVAFTIRDVVVRLPAPAVNYNTGDWYSTLAYGASTFLCTAGCDGENGWGYITRSDTGITNRRWVNAMNEAAARAKFLSLKVSSLSERQYSVYFNKEEGGGGGGAGGAGGTEKPANETNSTCSLTCGVNTTLDPVYCICVKNPGPIIEDPFNWGRILLGAGLIGAAVLIKRKH